MTDTNDDQGWGIVLSFSGLDYGETTEHAFVYGFEAGEVWGRMKSGHEAEIEQCVHVLNETILRRAAAAEGWDIEFTPTGDGIYTNAKLTKKRPAKPNPQGLHVVN